MLLELLDGPTAIAFLDSDADPAAAAKVLNDVAAHGQGARHPRGLLEGKTITEADVKNLASLPPTDVLRAQLVAPSPRRWPRSSACSRRRSATSRAYRRPDQAAGGAGRGRTEPTERRAGSGLPSPKRRSRGRRPRRKPRRPSRSAAAEPESEAEAEPAPEEPAETQEEE